MQSLKIMYKFAIASCFNSSCPSLNPTQLNTTFILFIIIKLPTFFWHNNIYKKDNYNISECFNARKLFIFQQFRFYEQLKFHAQMSWA